VFVFCLEIVGRPLAIGRGRSNMLRVERILDGDETVLRAAGRLTGPWVGELSRTMADEALQGRVVLDLTDVSFADHDGLAFLLSLTAQARVALRCSPFLTEQLSTAGKAKP
jgi:anti-anti-sigma regulatory factor